MYTFRHVYAILLMVLAVNTYAFPWPFSREDVSKRQVIDVASAVCKSRKSHWHGWSSVHNIFAFGDSYSSNGFDVLGTQPNSLNALGNPSVYKPNETCSCDGPNWLNNIVLSYNQSFIKLFDLAAGGAAVDKSLTPELFDLTPSMVQQVYDFFKPHYGLGGDRSATWSSEHTLFTAFFGINDLSMLQDHASMQTRLSKMYLYQKQFSHPGWEMIHFKEPYSIPILICYKRYYLPFSISKLCAKKHKTCR